MKKNQLLVGAFASLAALTLVSCSKTETIDAGAPPPVAPTPTLTEQPQAPAPQPMAGALKADEFRSFSSSAAPAKADTPAAGTLAAEMATFGGSKDKKVAPEDEARRAAMPKRPPMPPKPLVMTTTNPAEAP